MFTNEQIQQNPNAVRKLLDSWKNYAESLEKENEKLKGLVEELEEDLDRKENYVYHARDRSRED